MTNAKKKIYILISFAILSLPALFFPLSGDLSVMFLGGKSIADGGKLYVDFIDIKQPLIYYFFAVGNLFFGDAEIAPRILDYILQLLTAISTFLVIKKISANSLLGYLSATLYLLVYVTLNYSNTAQCESYVGIIIIFIIYYSTKDLIKTKEIFIIGGLVGLLGGLKITFGLLILLFPLIFLINNNIKASKLSSFFLFILGFVFFLVLTHLPLIDSEIFGGFKDATAFLRFYSDFPPIDGDFIRESLKKTAIFFSDNFSILLFFSFIFALILFLNRSFDSSASKLLMISFFIFFLFFISVALERKMMVYHYSRMILPAVVISAYGIISIYQIFREKIETSDNFTKIGAAIIISFLLLFSPLPRYFNLIAMSYFYFFDINKYNQMFTVPQSSSNNRLAQLEVLENLKNNNKKDIVLVVNSGGNIINHKINTKVSKFGHSCFYLSVFRIEEWRNQFLDELIRADCLIVQKNDRHYFMTRTNLSSYELLLNDDLYSDIIKKYYEKSIESNNFIIFKKMF